MFCNECGAQNMEGSKFCNNCGTQLHAVIIPVARTEKPEFYKPLDKLLTNPFVKDEEEPTPSAEESVSEEAKADKDISAEVSEPAEETFEEVPVIEEDKKASEVKIISAEESPLSKLSTYKRMSEAKETRRVASAVLDPIEDEYWDEPRKEIEAEIYSIPKENLLKIFGSIIALLVVIAWFIYML